MDGGATQIHALSMCFKKKRRKIFGMNSQLTPQRESSWSRGDRFLRFKCQSTWIQQDTVESPLHPPGSVDHEESRPSWIDFPK